MSSLPVSSPNMSSHNLTFGRQHQVNGIVLKGRKPVARILSQPVMSMPSGPGGLLQS